MDEPQTTDQRLTFREARRLAIQFAASTMENDDLDVIFDDRHSDDEKYLAMLDKAKSAAVASIRRLLK